MPWREHKALCVLCSHQDADGDEELELCVECTTQVEGGQLRQEQGPTLDGYAHTCSHTRENVSTMAVCILPGALPVSTDAGRQTIAICLADVWQKSAWQAA